MYNSVKETVGVGEDVMMDLLFAALPTLAGSTVPARNACKTCKQREYNIGSIGSSTTAARIDEPQPANLQPRRGMNYASE
jgi:hypothetical protein